MPGDVIHAYKAFQSEPWPEAALESTVRYARGSVRLTIPEEWREAFPSL